MSILEKYFDRWTLDNLNGLLQAITSKAPTEAMFIKWNVCATPPQTVVSRVETTDEGKLVTLNAAPFNTMRLKIEAGLAKLKSEVDQDIKDILSRALCGVALSEDDREIFERWKHANSDDALLDLMSSVGDKFHLSESSLN